MKKEKHFYTIFVDDKFRQEAVGISDLKVVISRLLSEGVNEITISDRGELTETQKRVYKSCA